MASDLQRLIYSIRSGRLDRFQKLLTKVDLNSRTPGGRTALHAAAEEGNVQATIILLDAGIQVDVRTTGDETPLHLAVSYGKDWDLTDADLDRRGPCRAHKNRPTNKQVASAMLEILREDGKSNVPANMAPTDDVPEHLKFSMMLSLFQLLAEGSALRERLKARGVDVDVLDPNFSELLQGNPRYLTVASLLLDRGADIQAKDCMGKRPIHRAVELGSPAMVRLLLTRGANATSSGDATGSYSSTPMGLALSEGNLDSAKILFEFGAEVKSEDSHPLHRAVIYRQKDLMLWLIERGVSVNERDCEGDTPLHCAARSGSKEIVEMLLNHGADPRSKNAKGLGILHLGTDNPDCMAHLLSLGFNSNDPDGDGWTPLHFAATSLNPASIRKLIESGAFVDAQNNSGNTAIHEIFFSDEYRPDIEFPAMHCLVGAGINRSLKNAAGKTAFDLAIDANYPDEYLKLLDPASADPKHAYKFIWIGEPEFSVFSSQAQIPLIMDGRHWPSSFHYFHAQKFRGTPIEEQIRAAKSVDEVWSKVHESGSNIRRDWSPMECMREALVARFHQNVAAKDKLLATENAILVEDTCHENFWSEGSSIPFNAIGRMLMSIRADLRFAQGR